jgi:hypothetical protein
VVRFVAAMILAAGVEAMLFMSFLAVRPITVGDFLGFVLFQWAPLLLLWLGIGLKALPRVRLWQERVTGQRSRAPQGRPTG